MTYNFTGPFENNRPIGHCKYEFSDEALYEGNFNNRGEMEDKNFVVEETLPNQK